MCPFHIFMAHIKAIAFLIFGTAHYFTMSGTPARAPKELVRERPCWCFIMASNLQYNGETCP